MDFIATTELEAVNVILENDGEEAVPSIDENGFAPASKALKVLHEVSRRIQLKGYNFNTDFEREFAPTVDNEIVLPPNVLGVEVSGRSQGRRIKQRGSRLYDDDSNSYTFTSAVTLDAVVFLPWEEVPEHARNYMTIMAARLYQKRETGSQLMDGFTYEDEQMAMGTFRHAENRAKRPNLLGASYISGRVSGRRL